ncbi:MAG: hypothetical protein IKD23_09445 [Lentisphaeria bacterium]|nr:hypothetical protein [Lentisphaeria bacterium]
MNLKEFSSTRKGQLIICCMLLGAVWLFLLIRFGSSYLRDIPDQKKISAARQELSKAQSEFEKVNAEYQTAQNTKKAYRELAASAWVGMVDGNVETALRRKISNVSEKLDFRLSRIGSTSLKRINNEFSSADITLQGSGELTDVIRFLAELAKIQPRLAWQQLSLTPDNRFRRPSQANTVNLAAQFNNLPATRLNFSGTLRVLVYEGPLTPEELNITRQPEITVPEEEAVEPEANPEVTEK